jgi:cellulose synthase/poly-beta-1,6-N-acetylglucosamine synthase-like glycosyltransferase
LLALAAAPAVAASGYLAVLALSSKRRAAAKGSSLRIVCLVPAHDEAAVIGRTLRSLRSVSYPEDRRRILVVADNCTDETAERARDAGAEVLVRHDPVRRGKGYALEHGFRQILEEGWADAVVVVDADTEVNEAFLTVLAGELGRGAEAVQAGSGVLNPNDSWRTQLMALALTLFNGVRSLGRERLGLSCGLRGNGMCLTTALLRRVPYRAFSVVEDLEYGLALGRAGIRVHYAHEARVSSAMVSSSEAAAGQRLRWEKGRAELARSSRWPLLREAIRRRDPVLFDLAVDLFVPPLSRLVLWLAAGTGASLAMAVAGGGTLALTVWASGVLLLTGYVARGFWLSGVGSAALLAAPRFVLWKLSLRAKPPPADWVRTARE